MTFDIADIIAGELKISRATAYDLMREALKEAAPVQEPCQYAIDVAMPEYRCVGKCQYAAQRQWVSLTDEEVKKVHTDAGVTYLVPADYDRHLFTHMTDVQIMKVSRAIEAKLREKNGGAL